MTLALGVLVAPGPPFPVGCAPRGDILPTEPAVAAVDKGGILDKGGALRIVLPFGKGAPGGVGTTPKPPAIIGCTDDRGGADDIGGTEEIGGTEDKGIGGTVIEGKVERGWTPLTGGIPGIRGALEEAVVTPDPKLALTDVTWFGIVCIGGIPEIIDWLFKTFACIGGTIPIIQYYQIKLDNIFEKNESNIINIPIFQCKIFNLKRS